jgi:SHS2 domain-containing protein
MLEAVQNVEAWEHFQHGADIGIRGFGATLPQALEQAALALTAIVTPPAGVQPLRAVEIRCPGGTDDFLLLDWINALIYEMATRNMLFSRFHVAREGAALAATAWGEPVDVARHVPALEPKGATFTELKAARLPDGRWLAQCVVDV